MIKYECVCSQCDIIYYRYKHPYPNNLCGKCQRDNHNIIQKLSGARAAHAAIQYELTCNRLVEAKLLKCVDCGLKANRYDHRDYNKPLDVESVCGS